MLIRQFVFNFLVDSVQNLFRIFAIAIAKDQNALYNGKTDIFREI